MKKIVYRITEVKVDGADVEGGKRIAASVAEISRLKKEGLAIFTNGELGLTGESAAAKKRGEDNRRTTRSGGKETRYKNIWPEIIDAAKQLKRDLTCNAAAKILHAQFLKSHESDTIPSVRTIRSHPEIKKLFRK